MQFKSGLYLSIFSVSIIVGLLVLYLKQLQNNRKQKLMLESLHLYNETLLNMYDGIRSIKHDFINFVQALNGYIQCNDMNGVRTMAASMYQECKIVCNMEELNPQVINNPAIYSLMVNKYKLASSKNIIMNIEITCSMDHLNIDTYTFCRILGILIDNAIEATNECENRMINVRMTQEAKLKILIIENSYQKGKVDLEKLFEKGYTTKSSNLEHGLGLWKVKNIIDHTENLELNTSDGDLFRQELIIRENHKNFAFPFESDKILLKQK